MGICQLNHSWFRISLLAVITSKLQHIFKNKNAFPLYFNLAIRTFILSIQVRKVALLFWSMAGVMLSQMFFLFHNTYIINPENVFYKTIMSDAGLISANLKPLCLHYIRRHYPRLRDLYPDVWRYTRIHQKAAK